ncbi:MAG: lamin tail domain-containing protein [Patescibacteria group bacterium]|nr:lamin tail domain-containing protein [Patescibacteria group bacterium]
MMKIIIAAWTIIILILVLPSPLEASELYIYPLFELEEIDYSYVRLNEIMPDPDGSDTDYEWIELYNNFEEEIDLSGCELDFKSIPSGTIIEGKSYLLIAKDLLDSDGDRQSFEQYWGDDSAEWGDSELEDFAAISLSISMKNSDDSVMLDCFGTEETFEWEASKSGVSFSRLEDGTWTDEYRVTPGLVNEPVPVVVYNHSILITEIYPSPSEDEYEWIELYNYSDEKIDLLNWSLTDNTKKQQVDSETIIQPKKHLVLSGDDLRLTLNNSGEKIALFDPNGDKVDEFVFKSTTNAVSNIRKFSGGKYLQKVVQTRSVTQGARNKFVDISDVFYGHKCLSIKSARNHVVGDTICIEGFITTEINKLGSKIFYIDDTTGGLQVYLSDESYWKSFKVGKRVRLLGELKETYGEHKLYVNDKNAVRALKDEGYRTPMLASTGKIGENLEGRLVSVTGIITQTSGRTFYIDDGSGELKILIKSSTSIDTPSKKKGQYAGIVGIVSQYGDDSYRVLPLESSDILISNEPVANGAVLAVTGENLLSVFAIIALVILTTLSVRIYKKSVIELFR